MGVKLLERACDFDRWTLEPDGCDYPSKLRELPKPPTIYGLGEKEAIYKESLSIIGARKATPYGIVCAEFAASVGVSMGLTIVSGGAVGIDQAAGEAALAGGGTNVVVLGCGADVVYPSSSKNLIVNTLETGGAIISCVGWGFPPARWTFPERNKVIAALSKALIVTEAGVKSGTMSTASAAAGLGRDIYCIPGSIFSPNSQGTNMLIQDGGVIIVDREGLEQAIAYTYGGLLMSPQEHSKEKIIDPVVQKLIASPMKAQELASSLNIDIVETVRLIGSYESKGLIERLADGRYSPTKRAFYNLTHEG